MNNQLFTLDDLRTAFKAGSSLKSWSDFGFEPTWDDFDQWYDFITNNNK